MTLSQEWQWLVKHIVLLAITAALILGSVYGVESIISKHDQAKSAELATIAQQMEKTNATTQQQNSQTLAVLSQSNVALQLQVAQLASTISNRDSNLKASQSTIQTLAPPELSAKWGAVANEPAPIIDNTGMFQVPLPLALKSTEALITVPVLQADLTDQKVIISNQVSELANNNKALASELAAHQSDNATCQADKKELNSQITTAKDDARKGKVKWFFIGLVTGILGGKYL